MGSITLTHHQPSSTTDHPDHLDNPPPFYWRINAPPHHPSRTSPFCPPFLLLKTTTTATSNNLPSPQYLSPKDFSTIITPNHLYKRDTWPQVRRRVQENKLAEFQRTPADMWRYLEFCWQIKEKYKEGGGIKEFILKERLKWVSGDGDGGGEVVVARGTRFAEDTKEGENGEEGDVKILWNDWPYGVDEKIVHLVVWTKFALEDDPQTGDLTEEARAEIDEFVKKKFQVGGRMSGEHIIWFKNWAHIKSVKAVEHFHVMLFDPDPEFVREITKGDIPLGIIHTDELTTNKNRPSTFSTTEETS
ncbi:hypothetical protein B0T13DRAFT_512765 [Neurospora crassa]|nr:hypothetical protein B0T13DRAFT_512765 [Neurospora crassa]